MSQVVHISVEPSARVDGIDHPSDWIHPYLVESANPFKGREFRATGSIAKGSCLLIDHPYAIIPVVDDPSANDNLICSYPDCNQRGLGHSERSRCPQSCTPDVAWCSSACRIADQARHSFECIWLKRYASPIRKKWSEYDFGMLWLVVRLLATRQMQVSLSPGSKELLNSKTGVHSQSNWQRIESLCGSTQTWPRDRVKFWTNLVKRYLQSSDILPHDLTKEALLHIICQEEANSFGLYPRETGSSALSDQQDRGEQFAAAVYPVAAIMNHSCSPNVAHKPDDRGHMVFTASRDILSGEECCIAYFDLTQYNDLSTRRDHLRRAFEFMCRCERCLAEEPTHHESEWSMLPPPL